MPKSGVGVGGGSGRNSTMTATAVLSKTFHYLASSVSGPAGPSWRRPEGGDGPDRPRDGHLPAGLASFLGALSRCRTAGDEAKLVSEHLAKVESALAASGEASPPQVSDALVRAMACHVLGHRKQAQFAKIYALQLAQKGNSLEKKMGYLACGMMLEESDPEILLLVNTLVKDLQSRNAVDVNTALVALSHLVPADMANMLLPTLIEKATHSKEFIRKKSLVCLQQILSKSPFSTVGPIGQRVFDSLSDSDPGVVATAVQAARQVCAVRVKNGQTAELGQLVPILVAVQGQILGERLPKEYTVKTTPAPFFQVDILNLLGYLIEHCSDEKSSSFNSIGSCLDKTFDAYLGCKENAAQMVLFECVKLAMIMERKEGTTQSWRVTKSFRVADQFLQNRHSNENRHMNVLFSGLECLEMILSGTDKTSLTSSQEQIVLDCLDSDDRVVQMKALSILRALATPANVTKITNKIINYVVGNQDSLDPFRQSGLIKQVIDLVDRFETTFGQGWREWKVRILHKFLRCSPDASQVEQILEKIKSALAIETKDAQNIRDEKKDLASKILEHTKTRFAEGAVADKDHELARLYFWLLANFHCDSKDTLDQDSKLICTLAKSKASSSILLSALQAIMVLLPNFQQTVPEEVADFVQECSKSSIAAVSDVADEILLLLPHLVTISHACKTFKDESADLTLTYLDPVVVSALKKGTANPFAIEPFSPESTSLPGDELKFSPYQQLDEAELSRVSSPASAGLATSPPSQGGQDLVSPPRAKWTLSGRVKEDEGRGRRADETKGTEKKQTSLMDALDADAAAASLDDLELNQWND